MTDLFTVMELPRAAWLDAEVLKERFHRLSAVRHPDAPGGSGAAFALLNEAWLTLREPVSRLRHFLLLTDPESLAAHHQTPAELGDLFMDIAAATHTGQHVASAREKAASPLARALLEPQRLALLGKVKAIEARLRPAIEEAHATIRADDELAATLHRLTFLSHWLRQIEELLLALGVQPAHRD